MQVLPYVVPKLVSIPVTPANARALAAIVDVTTNTIYAHFNVILPAMMTSMTGFNGISTLPGTDPDTDAIIAGPLGQAFRELVLAIRGLGVSTLLVVRCAMQCIADLSTGLLVLAVVTTRLGSGFGLAGVLLFVLCLLWCGLV